MTDGIAGLGRRSVQAIGASLHTVPQRLLERNVDRRALAHDQGGRMLDPGRRKINSGNARLPRRPAEHEDVGS
jgi:hypothetical protein